MNDRPIIAYASLSNFESDVFWRRAKRKVTGWLLRAGVTVLIAGVFLLTFGLMHPALMYVGLIACMLSLAVGAAGMRAARRRRARVVLTYVERGTKLNLPLPQFLRAAAGGETRRIARRLNEIARTIEASAPLGDALASELPELPFREAEIIRVAEANGSVSAALSRIARDARWQRVDDIESETSLSIPIAYAGAMLVAFAGAMFMCCVFVLPRLMQIFRDFRLPMPGIWMTIFTQPPEVWLFVSIVLPGTAALLVASVLWRSVDSLFFARRRRPPPLRRYFDADRAKNYWDDAWAVFERIKWHLPILGPVIRDRDWGDICTAIGEALAHHRPLDVAVREAAAHGHLNSVAAGRLDRWATLLHGGQPMTASARMAFLPTLIVGFLGGDRVPASAETFDFLGRHYRSRSLQRTRWIAAMAMPVMALLFGAVVLAFALTFYTPLWKLIDAVSATAYKVSL